VVSYAAGAAITYLGSQSATLQTPAIHSSIHPSIHPVVHALLTGGASVTGATSSAGLASFCPLGRILGIPNSSNVEPW
jgi:hypothetical protein